MGSYSIDNNCFPHQDYNDNDNTLVKINVNIPKSLKSEVNISLSLQNDTFMEKELIDDNKNDNDYNSFIYSYDFSNDSIGIYNINIHPISLYYENNGSLFSETIQIYSHNLSVDENSEYYYNIQVIHDEPTPQSVYFVFDDYLNENDVFNLSFSDKCYKNEKAIECYFSNYDETIIKDFNITQIIGCGENNIYNIQPPSTFNISIQKPSMKLITPNYIYEPDLDNKNISIVIEYNLDNNPLEKLKKIVIRKIMENNISFNFDDIEIIDYNTNEENNSISFNISSLQPHLYKIYSVFEFGNFTMIEPGKELYVSTYRFSLISPNEDFIYLNAPYIKFKFENISEIYNLNTTLFFNSTIDKNYSFSIECSEQSEINGTIFKCSLFDKDNYNILENHSPGYYTLFFGNYFVFNNIFLSKSLNKEIINVNIPDDLYIGNNSLTINSTDFYLNEISYFSFSNNETYIIDIEKKINETNNTESEIIIRFKLEKDISFIFSSITRYQTEYEENDNNCTVNLDITIKANMYYSNILFNKKYITLESKNIFNYEDDFTQIIIKGNDTEIAPEKIEGIYYTNANESDYPNKMDRNTNEWYKVILNNETEGIYKFAYKFKNRMDEFFPIEQVVIVVNNFSQLFNFKPPIQYITINYEPNIFIDSNNEYKEYLNLSEIGFLLNDKITNQTYNFTYENEKYYLNEDIKQNIILNNPHELIIMEHNSEYYMWKKEISIYGTPLIKKYYYKDRIAFLDDQLDFSYLYINNSVSHEIYNLSCKIVSYENEEIILCNAENLTFVEKIKDTFNIYYSENKFYEEKIIYNSFNDSKYNIIYPNVTNIWQKTNIIISSNNYFLKNIFSINITNIDNKTNSILYNDSFSFHENDNLIIINATLNIYESYIINSINDFISDYNIINETNEIELNQKLIQLDLYFEIVPNFLIIIKDFNPSVTIEMIITGKDEKYLDKIYYKLETDEEFNDNNYLKKSNNIYYIDGINKPGKYIFAYSIIKTNIKQLIYLHQIVYSEDDKDILFKIIDFTKCILLGQPFEIGIKPINNEIPLTNESQIFARLYSENEENYYPLFYNESVQKFQMKNKNEELIEGNYLFNISLNQSGKEYLLYSINEIKYSDFRVEDSYYKDYIYLNNVKCNFDMLGITPTTETISSIIKFNCESSEKENISICKVSTNIEYFGNYTIYFRNYNTLKTIFIYNTISDSYFFIEQPNINNEIYPGILSITIKNKNNDFNMPFLSHIVIKSDQSDTEDEMKEIIYNKNTFKFKINAKEGNTYSFYLYRKSIEGYDTKDNQYQILNDKITIKESVFDFYSDNIGLIDKSIHTLQNVTFDLKFKPNIINSLTINQLKINSNNNNNQQRCKILGNSIVNCYFIPKTIEASILSITFNYWTKYYYIFAYESIGTFCSNNNLGNLVFTLETSLYYQKQIDFKFNKLNEKIDCGNYADHSFKTYTCSLDLTNYNSNYQIQIDTKDNYNRYASLNVKKIASKITSISGKLIEGSLSQELKITFENKILQDEITECYLLNQNNKNMKISTTPKIASNEYQITAIFNLNNIIYGNYSLTCINKCEEEIKYNEIITVIRIKCSPPFVRFVTEENNPSCKFCNETDIKNIYYEEGKCVSECNKNIKHGIKPSDKYWCIYCDDMENKDEAGNYICLENCAKGTIEIKNECYLPDEPIDEIRSLSSDIFCKNLCSKDKYKECDRTWLNCTCNEGYQGLYCNYENDMTSIQQSMELINTYIYGNDDFNYSNPNLVSQIKSVLHLIQKNNDYILSISSDEINKYNEYIYKTIEKLEYGHKINLYYFSQLSLQLTLKNLKVGRRLIENNNNLMEIITNAHNINILGALESNLPSVGYRIFTDESSLISYIWYKKYATDEVYSYLQNYYHSTISLINFTECIEDNDTIVLTTVPNSLMSYIDNIYNDTSLGLNIYASSLNYRFEDIFSRCKNTYYQVYIPSSLLNYNNSLYIYYKNRGIDIYNKTDPAFTESCFQSFNFDYDLTQDFRKFKVYQNISFDSEYCKFIKIDNNTDKALFNCTGNQKNKILLTGYNDPYNKSETKVYNLPFKCISAKKEMKVNIGLILYSLILLSLIILSILYNILPTILNKNKKKRNRYIVQVKPFPGNPPHISEENSSENDETNKTDEIEIVERPLKMEYQNSEQQNITNEQKENENENENDSNNNNEDTKREKVNEKPIPIRIEKIKLGKLFIKNLFELHPILNLGNISEVSPLLINHFIFVFNISCVFGFSVLFLNEKRIEKRIYNNNRDNLFYPFEHEFIVIIFSILLSMIVKFLIRLIRFFVCKQNKILPSNNKLIKLTIIILMFLSTIFFTFYSILWCLMYYHTQFEWLYMGFWILLIQWIILSPIYILLLSVFYFLNLKNCSSIMSELNCF